MALAVGRRGKKEGGERENTEAMRSRVSFNAPLFLPPFYYTVEEGRGRSYAEGGGGGRGAVRNQFTPLLPPPPFAEEPPTEHRSSSLLRTGRDEKGGGDLRSPRSNTCGFSLSCLSFREEKQLLRGERGKRGDWMRRGRDVNKVIS